MKKIVFISICLLAVILLSCAPGKEEKTTTFISVSGLIRSQVAHVDTSLYPILKTVQYDSLHTDTFYIPREEFAAASADFMNIPDLADKKVARTYREEPPFYDQTLNRVIFSYTPVDPGQHEVKSQKLLATPVPGTDALINNIIITKEINNRDSLVHKEMLWQMNKSFQIICTTQKPGQPQKTVITKVTWNEEQTP